MSIDGYFIDCDACQGDGSVWESGVWVSCAHCDGSGTVWVDTRADTHSVYVGGVKINVPDGWTGMVKAQHDDIRK